MKKVIIILLILVGSKTTSFCQGVVDMHPNSRIFAMDFSTGNQVPAMNDHAILFKGAFIDLVSNTSYLRQQSIRLVSGQKTFVITQMEPQANGNAFQLVLENRYGSQTTTLCTFVYSVDQNALLYLNPQSQNYEAVEVEGYNWNNLNNCAANGNFNPPQGNYVVTSNETLDNQPVDAEVSVPVVPPDMPVYEQPACPAEGYQWQPGFWAYSRDSNGYYWVPGSWVAAPEQGYLWTPPYWSYEGNVYRFHSGYWGHSVGYYGGINYGYGYHGSGYVGGEWHEGNFRYNTAVVNVDKTVVHNTYINKTVVNTTVINNTTVNNTTVNNVTVNNHSSFNGPGGVVYKPNDHEVAVMQEKHVMPTQEQIINQKRARGDENQFASNNGGKPTSIAVAKIPPPTKIEQAARQPANIGGKGPAVTAAPGSVRNPVGLQPGANKTSPQSANNNITPKNENPVVKNEPNQQNSEKNQNNQPNGNQNRHPNNGNKNDPGAINNNPDFSKDANPPNVNQNGMPQPGAGNKNIPVNPGQKPTPATQPVTNNPAPVVNNAAPVVEKPGSVGQPPVNGQKPNNPKQQKPKPLTPPKRVPPTDDKKQ